MSFKGKASILIPLANLLNAGGAIGDIIYWDGTHWVRLAIGNLDDILQVKAGIPSWQSKISFASTSLAFAVAVGS